MSRAPTFTLLCCAAADVALKGQRVFDLVSGVHDVTLWRWLPASIGADLLLAVALALLVWATSVRYLRAAIVLAVTSTVTLGALACMNAISFSTTDAPITLQRLRGDDGARLADIRLLAATDVLPASVVVAAMVLATACAWWLHRRFDRAGFVRAAAALGIVGVAGVGAQLSTSVNYVARLSEPAIVVLARSVVFGTQPTVAFHSTYPAQATPALWRRISTPATAPVRAETAPVRRGIAAKNVVIVMAETLSFKHSSFNPDSEDTTPELKRLAQQGLLMTRAYSPVCQSIQAIYGVVCSDWADPNIVNIANTNPRIDCGEASQAFAAHGVKSGLFHAGNFGFSDKLALLGRRSYDVQLDAQSLLRTTTKDDGSTWDNSRWGIDDRAMVKGVLGFIDSLDKDQRFMALVIPISAHYPYTLWDKNVPQFPGTSQTQRYLSTVFYLDRIIAELIAGLKARGIDDDTAIIIVGDHGESHSEQAHETPGKRVSYEVHAHVPMVLLHAGDIPPQTSDRVVSLMDVLPTALDVMGLPPDARHHGRSIFATDWQPRRVFVAGQGDGAKLVGFVDNAFKFLVDVRTLHPQLYNLDTDPNELQNLAANEPAIAQYTQDAMAWRSWQTTQLKSAANLGDAVDIALGVATMAHVSFSDGSATSLLRARVRAGKRMRDCLLVQIPTDGSVRISGEDADWVRELSQLRIARLSSHGVSSDVTLTATTDGIARSKVLTDKTDWARLEVQRALHTLSIELKSSGPAPPLCLTVSEAAWNGKVPGAPDVAGDVDDEQ